LIICSEPVKIIKMCGRFSQTIDLEGLQNEFFDVQKRQRKLSKAFLPVYKQKLLIF